MGCIELNRPKSLNALNNGILDEISKAINEFNGDKTVGCVIITGRGRTFSAGAD